MSRRKTSELDSSVIREALEGSKDGFLRLYEHYADKVRYAVVRAAQQAGHLKNLDELGQEVWCRLLDHERRLLRRYDPTRGRFEPFISTVAYQQAIIAIGRYRRQLPRGEAEVREDALVDDEASRFAEELVQSDLFHALLARADAELDEDDRMLLREIYLEQRTCRSVASQLGISENAIYKRSERLKKKLARMVDELLHTSSASGVSRLPVPVVLGLVAVAVVMQAAARGDGAHGVASAGRIGPVRMLEQGSKEAGR